MSKKLVILGAGGYANTVKDVSEQLGYDVIAMLDDRFADRTLDSFTKYIEITIIKFFYYENITYYNLIFTIIVIN